MGLPAEGAKQHAPGRQMQKQELPGPAGRERGRRSGQLTCHASLPAAPSPPYAVPCSSCCWPPCCGAGCCWFAAGRRVAAGRRATGICRRAMAGWSRHRRRSLLLGRRHPGCGRGTRQVGAAAELPDGLPISYTGYGCLGSNRRRKTCAATGDGMWSAVDGAPQVQGGLSNQPKKLWES